MRFIRTIIDATAEPPKKRRFWDRRAKRFPPEIDMWRIRNPEAIIDSVVFIGDAPEWLWRACWHEGRDPGPLGCYVVWIRPEDSPRR